MNIEHLKLFIRVASLNNISLAGKELSLSPAVASTYLNKLEQSLGIKLIHRTTRQVSLTEEGKTFLPHAEEVVEAVRGARASVGSAKDSPQGTLRVTASASFARMHLIPALKGFMQLHPDLIIDIRMSDSIIDMVEGGFDVAIRNANLDDSSFNAKKLASDTRILCASPDYIAEFGEPQTPQQLTQHQCINLAGIHHWDFVTPQGTKRFKHSGALRIDNGEAIRDACEQGIGITICSKWCAYQQLRSGTLVQVLKDYPLVNDTAIWALYPSSRLLAPKVRVFVDYLSDHYTSQPYWQ
ncbi:LysR family transcriptional regulator [Thalassotalea sp. HSM 43]|uniref:LysR family transcriptional regulator n=1 Tax=Thalassotalea sp. HSM 43 TaxID=2552945 RepID=UPI0010819908|nr:LysR family transcriptional regulator [Thalassotalea sp. HSM 43]QBY05346.1 LysR family transcriptional regulator [Thalassotalea sp. HSM 43]